jgi:hypothetical protein
MPPKRVTQPRRPRRVLDEEMADESDMDMETPSDERDDSEGSLADFIEHDSAEQDDDSFKEEEEEEEASKDESEDVSKDESDEEEEEEEDPDRDVVQQYTPAMETTMGSVVVDGVRRSMRSTRGRAPVRYVDEEYAELMLEGATATDLLLSEEEDEAGKEEEESEAEKEEEEESESSSEELPPPPPPKKRQRRVIKDDE